MQSNIRKFWLLRSEDASGVSGVGIVAEGAIFTDGSCVIKWLSAVSSTTLYASITNVEDVHGHGGKTELIFEGDKRAPKTETSKKGKK